MTVKVIYDRGHSMVKMGAREFRGVVIAVMAVIAIYLLYR